MTNPNPNPNPQGGQDGNSDPFADLRGKLDSNGVPLHPEEKAQYYERKFKDSSKGAQELLEKNKTLAEENDRLKNTYVPPAPNNPSGDPYAPKNVDVLQKTVSDLQKTVASLLDNQQFERGWRSLILKPEFAKLAEHEADFKEFAYQNENLNSPLPILAKAFMVDNGLFGQSVPNPQDPDPSDDQDAGNPGLEGGTGGGDAPAPSEPGYTAEEAAKMRQEDPKKYARLIREGKLKFKE